ncbi:NUDIX hydrolase [Pseudobacteriovorax antillogorgiicola]|uniref:ADP-ribose pyrophosphatase YjhB, NUDIX family n=1 Tax=Pseudobacteriovorax antillogorgiicola TaxID=1513793 RepID=A0A1Y6BFX6_9BACT|nr:NUDIX hydrolase [Pseudobacteriovorax antillogorgiicola]TCS56308.1 ADP-ribose pyrophosphatase YjhB (NUDIX family) [Pseudobacteriovorax antillogorgiicola]SMF07265.1 ADP-ribose pyrophosphatase YjhB, NUDIX family [Pseudobacteriovorax antillogorgiicola]
MIRSLTRNLLFQYQSSWADGHIPYQGYNPQEELDATERFLEFIDSSDQCFERSHVPGHVTGSALICNKSMNQVLLLHHKKLNKWLQLGGHADGNPDPAAVAMKEAQEESGLQTLDFLNYRADLKILGAQEGQQPFPFDLDIHVIPARKSEPEHKHYDIRYLLVAGPNQAIAQNHEANDLRWFTLDEARRLTDERSMARQFDKLEYLQRNLL